ncbi:hypothetical protein FX985_05580 [Pseudomonas extremaustralis]|uniref:Uncharacterized protein n=1 Tax=Pseudomonas extremaustralis TaxID=359110 RepID=A0A5M9IT23_9PSED|nr:hypothetical protein [Pseudomonas extremaustralis]KAA8559212.1 hypothetical protein FX985_05580 [Pseudomonas extremaustralis]
MANASGKLLEPIEFARPSVRHAQGPTLNPLLARNGGTVEITLDDMSTNALYTVYFKTPIAGANPVIAPQHGNESKHLEFFVPAPVIGRCIGYTVEIFYTVEQNGVFLGQSLALDLTIMPLSPSDVDVPGVYLVEAGDSENLDLAIFPGSVNASLIPYPFIEVGQFVWCEVTGTDEDGQPISLWVMKAYEVKPYEVLNGFQFQITRYFLNQLANWSSIDVKFYVKYDRVALLEADPVQELRVTTKGIRQSVRYAFFDRTDFEFKNLNHWEEGSAINDPRDLIIQRSGDDWYAHFYTYTHQSDGVLLEKTFSRLLVGQVYSFSVLVQRANSSYTVPRLSLSADVNQKTPETLFPDRTQVKLTLEFEASSPVMTLQIHSHEPSGHGNDFNLRQIVVMSV